MFLVNKIQYFVNMEFQSVLRAALCTVQTKCLLHKRGAVTEYLQARRLSLPCCHAIAVYCSHFTLSDSL